MAKRNRITRAAQIAAQEEQKKRALIPAALIADK